VALFFLEIMGRIRQPSRAFGHRQIFNADPNFTTLFSMSIAETRYCESCRAERTFERPVPNHRLHLAATILTGGLWGVAWAAVSIYCRMAIPTCRNCETTRRVRETRRLMIGSQ